MLTFEQARDAARRFGSVAGVSSTTFEGRPVLWAFDVEQGAGRIVAAGSETRHGFLLFRCHEDDSFKLMLLGKTLAGYAVDETEPHTIAQFEPARVPREAWWCDSFYVARDRIDGMETADRFAVALHIAEVGATDPAFAERSIRARAPDLRSSADPAAGAPGFPDWWKLVRGLRRLRRLRELDAPELIVENELRMARDRWAMPRVRALATFPDDVHAIAAELGFATMQ